MLRKRCSILLIIFLIINCTEKRHDHTLDPVKVGLIFVPNVQFAPFYVALENGYFSEQKLAVDFEFVSPADAIQFVGIQKFDFIIADGEQVILARNRGLPVKYIYSIYSDYPLAIASLKEKRIINPDDLIGKIIGVPEYSGASYIGFKAFLKHNNIDESEVIIRSIGYTQAASLSEDRVDAAVVYVNNSPIQLKRAKKEFNMIHINDYISLVSVGIITNDSLIEKNSAIVRKFSKAFQKAIEFVEQNPGQALNVSYKFIEGGADVDTTQLQVLEESIKLYENEFTEKYGSGYSNKRQWRNTQDIIYEMKLINKKQEIDEYFTNEFID